MEFSDKYLNIEDDDEDDNDPLFVEEIGEAFEIPMCIPHLNVPIKLQHIDNYYIDGGWLSDQDIVFYMKLLKEDFPNEQGFENPIYFTSKYTYLRFVIFEQFS